MAEITKSTAPKCKQKLTAVQIETDCPPELQELGKRIAAHLEKARKCEEKAKQHYTAIAQHLAMAEAACDEGGFVAFHARFFPNLGQSRVYELLSIATQKKSVEEIRASTRARVAKHRANKIDDSVTVTEKPIPGPEPQESPTKLSQAEPTSIAPKQTPERSTSSGKAPPRDEALIGFSAVVAELLRRIVKRDAERFSRTSIAGDDLAKIGRFFTDLANLKKSATKPIDPVANPGNRTASAERSPKQKNAEPDALVESDLAA